MSLFNILKDYNIKENEKNKEFLENYGKKIVMEVQIRIYNTIKKNPKLIYETENDKTPYMYATLQNIYTLNGLHNAFLELLEKKKYKIKILPWLNGENLIKLAIKSNNMDILKYILYEINGIKTIKSVKNNTKIKHIKDIKIDINKMEPLILAIEKNNIEAIKLLLKEEDIKILVPDKDGLTPLHHVVKTGNNEIFNILLNKIIKTGENKKNYLDYAVNTTDRKNMTPLAIAIFKNRKVMAIKLLENGALLKYVGNKKIIDLLEEMNKNRLPIEKTILQHIRNIEIKELGEKKKRKNTKEFKKIKEYYKYLCIELKNGKILNELKELASYLNIKKVEEKKREELCGLIAERLIIIYKNQNILEELIKKKFE